MIVVKTRETKPQRKLENSHQEVKNAWGAFAVEGVPALLLVPKQHLHAAGLEGDRDPVGPLHQVAPEA